MAHKDASSYAPVPGNIPGTKVTLGGRDFILAPLNLNGVRTLTEAGTPLESFADGSPMAAQLARAIPAIHLSLLRNYPDITLEEVGELIDFSNVERALTALFSISGLETAKSGEPAPATQ